MLSECKHAQEELVASAPTEQAHKKQELQKADERLARLAQLQPVWLRYETLRQAPSHALTQG